MGKNKVYGDCALCGKYGELTFEHIQPRCCDNKKRVFKFNLNDVIKNKIYTKDGKHRGVKIIQKGFGLYSICESCNKYAGSYYINAYKCFYKQGLKVYENNSSTLVDLSFSNIYPLRIIKEIIMMFISVNVNNSLGRSFENYLLNKENQKFPKGYNIYAYFTEDIYSFALFSEAQRYINGKIGISCYSLVSFKPFGFILTYNSKPLPRYNEVCSIMAFSKYKYDEVESLKLMLPVINTDIPLTFPWLRNI